MAAATTMRVAPRMTWRGLIDDAIRSPLAQALVLAAAIGTFLFAAGPSLGLRDTFRGSPVATATAPDFQLSDQNGQPTSMSGFSGGAVVLTFIYTNCTTDCPLTTAKLGETLRLLDKDAHTAQFLAITVDPARDDQATLKAYADRFGLADRMRFLTGPADEVMKAVTAYHAEPIAQEALAATSSVDAHAGHVPPVRAGEISHPSVVLLIDAEGYQRFAYDADFAPQDLAHDIQLLQADQVGPQVPFPLE